MGLRIRPSLTRLQRYPHGWGHVTWNECGFFLFCGAERCPHYWGHVTWNSCVFLFLLAVTFFAVLKVVHVFGDM